MIIPSRSTIELRTAPTRSYMDRKTRLALVKPFIERHGGADVVLKNPRLKRQLAQQMGRSVKTVERAVLDAASAAPIVSKDLPQEFLVQVAIHGGVKQAHRRWTGDSLPSYATCCRRIGSDRMLQVALRSGDALIARYLQCSTYEAAVRNEIRTVDEMHVPLRVRGDRGKMHDDLHLVAEFDECTRMCVAAVLTVGSADETMALAAHAAAMLGGELDGCFVGGVADGKVHDRGAIFTSDAYQRALRRWSVPLPARPGVPTDKAKQERWHRTLQEGWLQSLPGYLNGQTRRGAGKPGTAYKVPQDPESLLSVEEVAKLLGRIIREYNTSHVVSTTGMTPLDAWRAASNHLEVLDPVVFWDDMIHVRKAKVQPSGVFIIDGYYTHPELGSRITESWRHDKDVEIRVVPSVFPGDRYFFGVDGHYVGELTRARELSEDQQLALHQGNAKRARAATAPLIAAGREVRAAVSGDPGVDDAVAERPEHRSSKKSQVLADALTLLEIEEKRGAA